VSADPLGKLFEAQLRIQSMHEKARSAPPEARRRYAELRRRMLEAMAEYGDFVNRQMGEPLQRGAVDLAAEIAAVAFESLLAGATLAKIFGRKEERGVMEAMEQNFQPRLVLRVLRCLGKLGKTPAPRGGRGG
jgi:hypothetical protein